MNVKESLAKVLQADRALREAREALLENSDAKAVAAAMKAEVEKNFGDDSWEAVCKLDCIAGLAGEVQTAESAALLVRLLSHEHEAVRYSAGQELVEHMYVRYAEVARLFEAEVDRALSQKSAHAGLLELPFLLAEVGEPGGVKIVARLLAHPSADVVAAAVQGLAQLGDPSVVPQLEALQADTRRVVEEDEEGETVEFTLGDLAKECAETLREQHAE